MSRNRSSRKISQDSSNSTFSTEDYSDFSSYTYLPHDTFWVVLYDNGGIKLLGFLLFLITVVTGIALIIALEQISNLKTSLELVKSNSETNWDQSDNITRIAISSQAFQNTTDMQFGAELDLLLQIINLLNANVVALDEILGDSGINLKDILEDSSKLLSNQLNFVSLIVYGAATEFSQTQTHSIIDLLNRTGYPFPSCAAIEQVASSSPSGNYLIQLPNSNTTFMFCNLTNV